MRDILPFLLKHGYAVLFLSVLAEQAGVPIPSTPFLLWAGALAGLGRLPLFPAIALSLAACLLSDSVWYWLGRRRGVSMLRLLCKISLEPDSCVSRTRQTFERTGATALLFAKFVPGLNTAAPPMAAITRMPYGRFLIADGAGSLIWSGAFLATGWLFRHQIEAVGERILGFGSRAAIVLGVLLAAYIGFKFWQRERFLHSLRVARVSPEDVLAQIEAGADMAILDLRNRQEMLDSGLLLPGAVWFDRARLETGILEEYRDRDVILYCS